MKNVIICLIVILSFFSCNDQKKVFYEKNQSTSDLVLIDLDNSLKFNWDITNGVILNDSLFDNLKRDYQEKRILLVETIRDTTPSNIKICSSKQQLKKGDLAFLLLDKMENLNYYKDLGIQMDTYIIGCPYPDHLLVTLDNQRDLIIEKLSETPDFHDKNK